MFYHIIDMNAYYYDNGTNRNPKWSKNWGDIIGPTIIKHFSKIHHKYENM